MRWVFAVKCAAALLGIASTSQAADSTVYRDSETGFTFSQFNAKYTLTKSITFRIAVPSPAPADSAYGAVVQVIAPIDVGWAGLAWGGTMTSNPLTVAWANGNGAVISSRYTPSRVLPPAYPGATYQLFKTGTRANSTHWQYTALCNGCTSYVGSGNRNVTLSPTGSNRFAFAMSSVRPSSSSNTSSFNVHEVTGYWSHDFAAGGNAAFSSLVAANM